jgi:hypothetical protein
MGDVVPREAMDPDFDFRPDLTEHLVQDFLRGLDPATNRLLRTPKEMLECGFKGVPYTFDMEEDRKNRNDW